MHPLSQHSATTLPGSDSALLYRLLPLLRWFPPTREGLRGDLIAGVTVTLILIPQSMAYAQLAGLPVVYGLYASFLPVMIASMWGASRFLHTGPVALLSLMSAAAIEPLASRGSVEFIQWSMTLALMVGVMRLALGLMRMGVLLNLASHPVVSGFTNAAALIIGLSLLNTFLNVPMPRSDVFLRDLWHVVMQLPLAHAPTIAFGLGTLVLLALLKRYAPQLPGVLLAVVVGTAVSAGLGFERTVLVTPAQIEDAAARQDYDTYARLEAQLAANKKAQAAVRERLSQLERRALHDYSLEAELLRLTGEEAGLKKSLYGQRVAVHRHALVPVRLPDGTTVYRAAPHSGPFATVWRFNGLKDGRIKLSAGGQVVGTIPAGLPSFSVPPLDPKIIGGLLGTAALMALIGFMEATSISRALAAKTRERLDPNQELIGQGLANIVGSFFQSYTVSGSFSRSAVAARAGAHTGLYAVVSALGVVLVMLYLTPYLYHLPQSVLAAIVMSAVFGLIDFKPLRHAWRVRRADGLVGWLTFAATLAMAPQLANGVLIGVLATIAVFLHGTMQPRSEVLGRTHDGRLAGAASHDLPPVSDNYVVMRFDASLVFINAAYFEQAVMRALAQFPKARAVLILGDGINRIDATGEEKLRALAADLSAAGVALAFSGLKKQVREAFTRAGLDAVIGPDNIFPGRDSALAAMAERYDRG
ncbi:MAG: SulP family inorganic anion transporter [Thiobacillaceae bacterium]|uniref:SulP family inorganic anion transporter n=1 Tax=Tepidimonas sp. TaxID=2002775 RepID=UPI00298ED144|nr:SulP family inorganic anion transporter [Tepidimonas sp.]MCS6786250.1 SulP family inorganic anion transporter [Thiobacillaceae bacterium]MDW8337322.1 SulP family inorganic anion transporter [Tepidimonas sp.]